MSGLRRYLEFLLSPSLLMVVALISFGETLAIRVGYLGIWLSLTLGSWFFKYCFAMMDAAVLGERQAPVLSVEMLNPIDEQRPLAQLLLTLGVAVGLFFLQRWIGHLATLLLAGISVAILPAEIAVLGVTRHALVALWPPALLRTVRGLGRDYLLLLLSWLVAAVISYLLMTQDLPWMLRIAGVQWLWLAAFAAVGMGVCVHRHDLGLEIHNREDRQATEDALTVQRARARMLDQAHVCARTQRSPQAWQEIQAWLDQHGDKSNLQEHRQILEALSQWNRPEFADKLASEIIAILMGRRENGQALELLEQRLVDRPDFIPGPPVDVVRLREIASLAGKRALAKRLAG